MYTNLLPMNLNVPKLFSQIPDNGSAYVSYYLCELICWCLSGGSGPNVARPVEVLWASFSAGGDHDHRL